MKFSTYEQQIQVTRHDSILRLAVSINRFPKKLTHRMLKQITALFTAMNKYAQSFELKINAQYLKYIAHVCRAENNAITKKIMFAKATRDYYRDPWIKISKLLGVDIDQAKRTTQSRKEFAELVRHRISKSP